MSTIALQLAAAHDWDAPLRTGSLTARQPIPSQYSSADKVRMGRISKAGKEGLRAILVEACWLLIGKDPAMREKYDRIKVRAGGKRAVVAIARMLLLRIRRILIDQRPYLVGVVA